MLWHHMDDSVYKSFFAGKRVTMMGLGLLGRGVGDAGFIASLGATVTITDLKSKDKLASSVAQLAAHPNITFVLGEHRMEDFTDTDMVIKSAGVPLNSPYIAAAHNAGVPVYMSTALAAQFARAAGATVVGTTGTRGKSTVSYLIHHVLAQAGKRVHLGGNVRGLSTLAMLPQIGRGDVLVLELDSWQLQGFGTLGVSPDIAVFTNLMMDHLNYYPSMDVYFADKANIYLHQKAGNLLVVGSDIEPRISATKPRGKLLVPAPLPASWRLKILGEHNRQNASLAVEALRALGLDEKAIRKGVESFGGVEGRLQHLADIRGVPVYNDNNSSTPDAVIAALAALAPLYKVTLIAGGADKKVRLEALAHQVSALAARTILLPGSGTDNLKPLLKKYEEATDVRDALKRAFVGAKKGDAILFSPGFASFSQFANEYERNDAFVAAVKTFK